MPRAPGHPDGPSTFPPACPPLPARFPSPSLTASWTVRACSELLTSTIPFLLLTMSWFFRHFPNTRFLLCEVSPPCAFILGGQRMLGPAAASRPGSVGQQLIPAVAAVSHGRQAQFRFNFGFPNTGHLFP